MKYTHEDGTPFTKEEFLQKLKTDSEFNDEFGNKGIDQIANSINLLKTDPDSRRNRVSAWNVGELNQMVLPPCHTDFQVYTRELSLEERFQFTDKINKEIRQDLYSFSFNHPSYIGDVTRSDDEERQLSLDNLNIPRRSISLMYNTRSQDVPLGTPFNIASYALLLMMIAKQVNMIPDELITNMGDCHIYSNQIDGVKEQLTRTQYELPTVKISNKQVNDISEYEIEDFILENYKYHPSIRMPLSN